MRAHRVFAQCFRVSISPLPSDYSMHFMANVSSLHVLRAQVQTCVGVWSTNKHLSGMTVRGLYPRALWARERWRGHNNRHISIRKNSEQSHGPGVCLRLSFHPYSGRRGMPFVMTRDLID
jgi:hypothetical protein